MPSTEVLSRICSHIRNLRHRNYYSLVLLTAIHERVHHIMFDMDMGHKAPQCETQQPFPCNHALIRMITYDNIKLQLDCTVCYMP